MTSPAGHHSSSGSSSDSTTTATAATPTATTNAGFQSIAGVLESEEPVSSPASLLPALRPVPRAPMAAASASVNDGGPLPLRHQTLAGPRAVNASGSPSPQSSRDTSPARHHRPAAASPAPTTKLRPGLRTRNSSTDVSPGRTSSLTSPSSTVPSASALQSALASANVPQLPSASPVSSINTVVKLAQPTRPSPITAPADATPRWPISPRLKSPEPSRKNPLRTQVKKPEAHSTPAIVVQGSSPASISRIAALKEEAGASDPEEPALSIKGPTRGASGVVPKLETVQESSLPTTPGFDCPEMESSSYISVSHKGSDEERNDVSSSRLNGDLSTRNNTATANSTTGSGSDSGPRTARRGKMQEKRASSTYRSSDISAKPSLSSLSIRSQRDPPLRNVTVETETVSSIAQAPIGNQDRSASSRVDGSLRLKASNETIRPKKEKKPNKRKAPSINAGTASSKADVFEQKVASAVDEANSSDSDATFIYESNPPEQQPHRSRHHHSRTPSMTSITSLVDPRQLAIRDAHKNPGKKSSMKFANAFINAETDALDRGDGNLRIGSVRVGQGSHHHHIGRHGQGRGALSHVVMDSDSSMAQSSRARGLSSRHPSQPNSPRFHTFSVTSGQGNGTKKNGEYSAYDIDAEHAADDERTPLIPSGRSPRVRTPRRRNSMTLRHLEQRHRHRHDGGWCRNFAGCLVLSILLLVVVFSSVGLVFATTKPLTNVKIREVQNVVASQNEIIMDLIVGAINPNIIGVTIADMDVTIFAKSKHLGSDTWWRLHGDGPRDNTEDWLPVKAPDSRIDSSVDGIDEGTDPIDDPESGEPRTMSLGHISHFDSPLNFDSSFWQRKHSESIGEIRLSHPGNESEVGGIARWEEVLLYPFELIVRGIFKYQLPLSTKEHKVPVTASYYYDPDAEKKKIIKKKAELAEEKIQKQMLPHPVLPTPLGRYDRRALPLLESQ